MTDADLVLTAQRGEPAGLALLLQRHEPHLYAIALQVLRRRDDARDAVQDAFVIALEKIHQVRDPAAVGGWLNAVVRNVCRMRIRRDITERRALAAALAEGAVQARLEEGALGDWLWPALAQLPEALRVTLLLRHFGLRSSYEQIAALLNIPIGTVRSRLAAGRERLAALLQAGAVEPDPALLEQHVRREQYYRACMVMHSGADLERFIAHFTEDLVLYRPGTRTRQGRRHWQDELTDDLEHGVLAQVDHIMSSGSLTTIELRFQNSAEFPEHCPHGGSFVFWHRGEQTQRIHGYMDRSRPPPTA